LKKEIKITIRSFKTSTNVKTYGWYSARAEKRSGSLFYLTEGNRKVIVTAVSLTETYEEYAWEDKMYVGEVEKYLGVALKGNPDEIEKKKWE
jgi:hypothetical protein